MSHKARGWLGSNSDCSWLLSGISGVFSAITGVLIANVFYTSNLEIQIVGWTALMTIIILFLVNLQLALLVHNGYRN
ncbi:MAG: hypothetical protein V7K40_12535 [Nostoc sp.]|uniref:hypothetical protein n=1 Tax=Nostoc sp. TaxID=1180 RepID=UPI002FF9BA75